MDTRRVPINVSVNNPSDYSSRSFRLAGNSDIRDKMNQRMREFEEESRKWREQFMSPQPSLIDHNRPRMFVFPEFPEMNSNFSSQPPLQSTRFNGASGGFLSAPSSQFASQNSHKSYIEEDDHGHKRYKMVFEIGDFKPNEIQVKTEGRQLIVKGDREIVAGGSTESKQFNREITLPDFVEPTSVTSYLSEGALTVEAPVVMDRLGYSSAGPSTLRNSPYRDHGSPSQLGNSSFHSSRGGNFRGSREDLLNSNLSSHQQSQYYNDTPTITVPAPAPPVPSSVTSSHPANNPNSQIAQYKFNMSEFRPEDISITVTDTSLKIHAVREENDTRGSGKTYREFKREIGLPQGADVKRLKNSLQPDGTLIIDIPVSDNTNMRPPLSPPSQLNKQFSNFTLNDVNNNNNANSANNSYSSSNYHNHHHHQQQQQQAQQAQQQQQQQSSFLQSSNQQFNNGNNIQMNGNNGSGGLVDTRNDGKDLRLTFDLAGYKPEDLSIKVVDNNTLRVNAVHIDNTRGNQIHREYTRQYILPDWVQPELLRARMSDNGTLTVEVPLPQHKNSSERQININR